MPEGQEFAPVTSASLPLERPVRCIRYRVQSIALPREAVRLAWKFFVHP